MSNNLYNNILSQACTTVNNQQGFAQAAIPTHLSQSLQNNASYANQLYNMHSMQQAAYKQTDLKEMLQFDIKHLVDEERAELMIELMNMDDDRLMLFKLFLSK